MTILDDQDNIIDSISMQDAVKLDMKIDRKFISKVQNAMQRWANLRGINIHQDAIGNIIGIGDWCLYLAGLQRSIYIVRILGFTNTKVKILCVRGHQEVTHCIETNLIKVDKSVLCSVIETDNKLRKMLETKNML